MNTINDIMSYIYEYLMSNWDDIENDKDVMNILDVNTNNMCIHYKNIDPTLDDKHVQIKALTLLFTLLLLMFNMTNDNIIDID